MGLLAMAAAAAFAWIAWRARALNISGAVAAGLLAWILLLPAELAWAGPGGTFFVLSTMLTRVGRRRKKSALRLVDKTGPRDAGQVIANGGVAGALVAGFLLLPDAAAHLAPAFYWGMVGAFAAATADTWATEVGTLVRGRTFGLLSMRETEPGVSGGVSAAGTLAAVLGALTIFCVAWLLAAGSSVTSGVGFAKAAALSVGGAMAGCLFDSVLGGTLQARYRLPAGDLTERRTADGVTLPHAAGVPGITNDLVNVACTLVGAAIPFGGFIRDGLA